MNQLQQFQLLVKIKTKKIVFIKGFNVETVSYNNMNFTVWDIGGQDRIRTLWKHYFENTQAVIFVADSNDVDRIPEAAHELSKIV